ncbi:P-loop containing nucleoside triphosphate hydrolase [Vibrio phage 2.275.O._10N.286.54.E11]|nr:P-loop containing nucleoside triphosphate hydrolase [Vibrio phage 2.275.O._10N.286.54.E11]
MKHTELKLYILDAIAGAGKTRAIIYDSVRNAANNERVLIIQETLDLLDQTYVDINNWIKQRAITDVKVKRIHSLSKDSSKGVAGSALERCRSNHAGEILLLTKETFFEIRTRGYDFTGWVGYVDEFLNPFNVTKLSTEWKSAEVFESLYIPIEEDREFNEIGPSSELYKILKSKPDDYAYNAMKESGVIRSLSAPYIRCFIDDKKEHLATLITPDIFQNFKEVTICGAKYNYHEMSMFWRDYDILESPLKSELLEVKTEATVCIAYVNKVRWSSSLKRSSDLMSAIGKSLNEWFVNENYIISEKERFKNDLGIIEWGIDRYTKTETTGGVFIGCNVAGMNNYRQDTNAAFLRSLGRPISWYKAARSIMEFSMSDIFDLEIKCHNAYSAYQFLYRTNIRIPTYKGEINYVVGSELIASTVKEMINSDNVLLYELPVDISEIKDSDMCFAFQRLEWKEEEERVQAECKHMISEINTFLRSALNDTIAIARSKNLAKDKKLWAETQLTNYRKANRIISTKRDKKNLEKIKVAHQLVFGEDNIPEVPEEKSLSEKELVILRALEKLNIIK